MVHTLLPSAQSGCYCTGVEGSPAGQIGVWISKSCLILLDFTDFKCFTRLERNHLKAGGKPAKSMRKPPKSSFYSIVVIPTFLFSKQEIPVDLNIHVATKGGLYIYIYIYIYKWQGNPLKTGGKLLKAGGKPLKSRKKPPKNRRETS